MRPLAAALILTAAVRCPAAEPLPQSTLRLPQTTLDCPCPAGGPCACGPGGIGKVSSCRICAAFRGPPVPARSASAGGW